MSFENRIVAYGEEAPDQLLANPRNWRIHPAHQQKALRGVLSEVGFVQSIIVNKRTGFVVDGHLRVTLALREGVEKIPVCYVDLSEDEERAMLAQLDPIGALAVADDEKLKDLIDGLEVSDGDVRRTLDALRDGGGAGQALAKALTEEAPVQESTNQKPELQSLVATRRCPACGHEWQDGA